MCKTPIAAGFAANASVFCSKVIPIVDGCVDGGMADATRGWCCTPDMKCGTDYLSCECITPCGSDCCKKGEECVSLGVLRGKQCKPPCAPGFHHDGDECVCDTGETCGLRCCGPGTECHGGRCIKPPPPGKLPTFLDGLTNFGDVGNQSAGSRGGGHARDAAAAAAPVGALLALAAVGAQAAAAGAAFAETNVDDAYRRKVIASRPSLPSIAAGPGLDPRAASALESLLTAEAKGFSLALASASALARARGALRHHNQATARKQVRAAAGFADGAAKALRSVPALRAAAAAALVSTGAAEVMVTTSDVAALQADVRAHGMPADLRDLLRGLGVTGHDLVGAQDGLLVAPTGGPTLIAPLADPARTRLFRSIGAELAAFSRRARRTPILQTRGAPKRYRPSAVRTG
jgi:hypothetical protein